MWWLAVPAVLAAGALLAKYITSEEKEARENWDRSYQRVILSVEGHRKNIEDKISEARDSYSFHLLTDVHYSSVKVADEAYRLLTDARKSLDTMGRILVDSREKKNEYIRLLGSEKDREKRVEYTKAIKELTDFRNQIFPDKDTVKEQRDNLLSEVRRLNGQTHELKIAIRDRCGSRGQEWFSRIELKKKQRG